MVVMHQGHTESLFDDDLRSHGSSVERPVEFIDFTKTQGDVYPLKAHLKDHLSGMVEEVPAKYILGCDGGRSIVRKILGIESSIHHTKDTWAVADTKVLTDFPDAQRHCSIRTENGSVMLIPKGDDRLRIYTLLSEEEVSHLSKSKYEGKSTEYTNDSTVFGVLEKRVASVLNPYKIEIVEVDWVSMYLIAQRITDSFSEPDDRVFILGDACHTHSPKAGQGKQPNPP